MLKRYSYKFAGLPETLDEQTAWDYVRGRLYNILIKDNILVKKLEQKVNENKSKRENDVYIQAKQEILEIICPS